MAKNTIRGNVYSPDEDYPAIIMSNSNPLLYTSRCPTYICLNVNNIESWGEVHISSKCSLYHKQEAIGDIFKKHGVSA